MTGAYALSARQLALPLDEERAGDSELIVTAANEAAVALLERPDRWPVRSLILSGPRKSGRSLHARLAAKRTGARVLEAADRVDETAVFDAWNEAERGGPPLILLADRPPPAWTPDLPDLRSRLAASPVARLADPDEAMADALLEKLLLRRGLFSGVALRREALIRLPRSHLAIVRFADAVARGPALTRQAIRDALFGEREAA